MKKSNNHTSDDSSHKSGQALIDNTMAENLKSNNNSAILETDNGFIDENLNTEEMKKTIELKINPNVQKVDPDHDPSYVKSEKKNILYPNNPNLQRWELWITIVLVFSLFTVPWEIAFGVHGRIPDSDT